jgi:hypothetical protein
MSRVAATIFVVRTIVLFPLSRSLSLDPARTKNDYENENDRIRTLPLAAAAEEWSSVLMRERINHCEGSCMPGRDDCLLGPRPPPVAIAEATEGGRGPNVSTPTFTTIFSQTAGETPGPRARALCAPSHSLNAGGTPAVPG